MRNKILLICILCTLVALVLQTMLLLNVSSNMVYEQARDIAYNSLDNMQNELGSYIEGIENSMVNIYNDKMFLRGNTRQRMSCGRTITAMRETMRSGTLRPVTA